MRRFLIFVLVFSLFFGLTVNASSNSSSNIYTYEVGFRISANHTVTLPSFTGSYSVYHDSTITLDNFADNLFNKSGSKDIIDGLIYVDSFVFSVMDIHTVFPNGTIRDNQRYPVGGTAWFNNDTGNSFAVPWDGNTPVTGHVADWDKFHNSSINSRYLLWSFGSPDSGATVTMTWTYTVWISIRQNATLGNVIDAINNSNGHVIDIVEDKLDDINNSIISQTSQDKQLADKINSTLEDQMNQDMQFRQDDLLGAQGAPVGDNFTQVETTVKSKWSILWYPITFTNKLLSAFNGNSARSPSSIVGYRYDDDTGGLEPIYDYSRAANSGGATITFPAYTLPILNLKLWDSYTYDLSTLPDQYPALFNLLYVAIGVLEVYWFVGFLRNKYDDIFGG